MFVNPSFGTGQQVLQQVSCRDQTPVQPAALCAGLRAVMARHDCLRTGFAHGPNDRLGQFVAETVKLPWRWEDWSNAGDTRSEDWSKLLDQELGTEFDVERPPLWRVVAVRMTPTEIRWVWTFHHGLLDGASTDRIVGDWLTAYNGNMLPPFRGRSPLGLANAMASSDQNNGASASSINHWRTTLEGLHGATRPEQPLRSPLPQETASVRLSFAIELTPKEDPKLTALEHAVGVTRGTAVLAAWAMTLAVLRDEKDVVFGAVRTCRHATGSRDDDSTGMMMNTVPMRFTLDGSQTVRAWLRRIREQQLALRDAELSTVDDIRSAVPEWVGELYHSIVLYEHQPPAARLEERWGDGGRRRFTLGQTPSRIPLTLLARGEPRLRLEVISLSDHFDLTFVRSIAEVCATVVRAMAENIDARLSELPLVSTTIGRTLRSQLTGPKNAWPVGELYHHAFERTVDAHPQRVAVRDTDSADEVTYAELDARVALQADRLQALGVGPNVLCAVALPRSVRLVTILLGVLRAGGAPLCLDSEFPVERLVRSLNRAKPIRVVADETLANQLKEAGCEVAAISPHPSAKGLKSVSLHVPLPLPSDLAYAVFTSGSTGEPKLVGVEHVQAVNLLHHAAGHLITAQDAAWVPWFSSPSFDACIVQMMGVFFHGGCLVPIESAASLRRSPWWQNFTCLGAPPGPIAHLVAGDALPPNLQLVNTGAETVPAPLIEALARQSSVQRIHNFYGPTEGGGYCTTHTLFDRADDNAPRTVNRTWLGRTIGTAISNARLRVVSAFGQDVPAGWPGELWIAGPLVARGYLKPGSAEVVDSAAVGGFEVDTEGNQPESRLYRTGDRVVLGDDGLLRFIGRRDAQIKFRGLRFEPGEVCARLREFPGVSDAWVEVRDGARGHPVLAAWIVATPAPSVEAVREFAARQLPLAAVPSVWAVLPQFPLTPGGKIDFRQLKLPQSETKATSPETSETEQRLLQLWEAELDLGLPGMEESFFTLGGDSFLAVKWVTAIERNFGQKLPIGAFARWPSIRGMAQWLDDHCLPTSSATSSGPTSASFIKLADGKGLPPLLIFPGGDGGNLFLHEYRDFAQRWAGQRNVFWFARHPGMDINSGEDALMQELARKAAAVIRRDWPGQPVCLFGHCLGSALAWAVTVELRRDQSTAVELVLCDPWLERERKMRTPPGKWRGRFLAYRSAWRYWRDSRTGNDSRYFWTFVRNQWEDRKHPRIDLDASSAFYVGALRHYDFGPILSGNLRLVRNRREARLFAPVAWSAKVNGDVTTTFFESGHTHSLKEIGAKVIRAMSS